MHAFVTLFNHKYLLQGIVLIKSIISYSFSEIIYIICLDDTTYSILEKKKFNRVVLIKIENIETNELKEVKKTRTFAEYCWTLTPFSIKHLFNINDSITSVTYLDADIMFLRNIKLLYQNFFESKKKVLITYHGYDPIYDASEFSGRHCVQFLTFKKNNDYILDKWSNQCLDWCYNRHEEGKFGDQMYLHKWDETYFDAVATIENINYLLAPWNANRFPYSEACLFHFHSLKIYYYKNKLIFDIGKYFVPDACYKNVYVPYFKAIKYEYDQIDYKDRAYLSNPINFITLLKTYVVKYILNKFKIFFLFKNSILINRFMRYRQI